MRTNLKGGTLCAKTGQILWPEHSLFVDVMLSENRACSVKVWADCSCCKRLNEVCFRRNCLAVVRKLATETWIKSGRQRALVIFICFYPERNQTPRLVYRVLKHRLKDCRAEIKCAEIKLPV